MALPVFASFAAMLALTVLTSTVYTPAQIIADAAVMAASTHVRRPTGVGPAGAHAHPAQHGPAGAIAVQAAAALLLVPLTLMSTPTHPVAAWGLQPPAHLGQ